ncbi:hypothetical protein LCGC14_2572300 [marine sediment metagenome]|uniref:Uncharacterized protein n=1 Tax=marine sediment metagenome TaxID=412755 RepID=A0A0F9B4U3_9ZZZZ
MTHLDLMDQCIQADSDVYAKRHAEAAIRQIIKAAGFYNRSQGAA